MAYGKRHLLIPLVPLCLMAADPQTPPPAPAPEPAPWLIKVAAPDDSPVPQATVWFLGEKGNRIQPPALTDGKGEIQFRPPKEGAYTIRVAKGGFRLTEKTLKTSPKEAPPVLIRLEKD